MVQAAAAGIIDFSKVDPLDKQSRLRTRLLLQETNRRIAEKQSFAGFLRAVALTSTSPQPIADNTYSSHAELITVYFNDLFNLIFPREGAVETDETVIQKATRQWEETFGVKMDGPEVQAVLDHMKAVVDASQQRLAKQAEEEQWLANYTRKGR